MQQKRILICRQCFLDTACSNARRIFPMPKHLEEFTLETPVRNLLDSLGEWLATNGSFEPGLKNFEKCTSPELRKQVGEVWRKIVTFFNDIRATNEVSNRQLRLGMLPTHPNPCTDAQILGRSKSTTRRGLDNERRTWTQGPINYSLFTFSTVGYTLLLALKSLCPT